MRFKSRLSSGAFKRREKSSHLLKRRHWWKGAWILNLLRLQIIRIFKIQSTIKPAAMNVSYCKSSKIIMRKHDMTAYEIPLHHICPCKDLYTLQLAKQKGWPIMLSYSAVAHYLQREKTYQHCLVWLNNLLLLLVLKHLSVWNQLDYYKRWWNFIVFQT